MAKMQPVIMRPAWAIGRTTCKAIWVTVTWWPNQLGVRPGFRGRVIAEFMPLARG